MLATKKLFKSLFQIQRSNNVQVRTTYFTSEMTLSTNHTQLLIKTSLMRQPSFCRSYLILDLQRLKIDFFKNSKLKIWIQIQIWHTRRLMKLHNNSKIMRKLNLNLNSTNTSFWLTEVAQCMAQELNLQSKLFKFSFTVCQWDPNLTLSASDQIIQNFTIKVLSTMMNH